MPPHKEKILAWSSSGSNRDPARFSKREKEEGEEKNDVRVGCEREGEREREGEERGRGKGERKREGEREAEKKDRGSCWRERERAE